MLVVVCVVSIIRFGGGRIVNLWLKPDWDRGYEAGRKAGLEEAHRYQHQCNADLETRAKLREEGRELEQERIIEIIEKYNGGCLCGVVTVCYLHRLIALIKGEK
jgi:hypothetical protein